MGCPETQELLDAYLDGELDLVRALEVERHLTSCPACTAAFAGLQSLQTALRSSPLRHRPPARLEARIRAGLRQQVGVRRRFVGAVAGGTAAAALLLGAAWLWHQWSFDPVARGVEASYARSLLAGNVAGVGASDQQGVQPWLAARLDYTPPVPDAKGCGFNLVGGRVDDLAGRRVAALVYQRGESVIDLFVWPTTQNQNGKLSVLSRQGYSLIHWERDGMTWWAVSNDNAAELRSFVSHINPQS